MSGSKYMGYSMGPGYSMGRVFPGPGYTMGRAVPGVTQVVTYVSRVFH